MEFRQVRFYCLNQAGFIAARMIMPTLLASPLGIRVAALVSFMVINHLVFKKRVLSLNDTDQRIKDKEEMSP
jgi:hypothetical protein